MPESASSGAAPAGAIGTAALARAVAALRAAAPALDATALAEALWLAARMDAAATAAATDRAADREPERSGESGSVPADPPWTERAEARPQSGTEGREGHAGHEGPDGERALHERLPGSGSRVRGDALTAPRGARLPLALDVTRALRPWKRQWRPGRRHELDVEATVDGYARSGELIPAFRAAPERWFDLVLVVDRSPSMQVWKDTVGAFAGVLDRLGAFRTLQIRDLTFDGPAGAALRDGQGRPTPPGRLRSPDGRRLVVVVSDCTAGAWRRPQVWQQVRDWSLTTPVALLNPLPAAMWRRTGLDLPTVRVAPAVPGAHNAQLVFDRPPLLPPAEDAGQGYWLPIPVLSLSPHSLDRWSRTVMRAAPDGCGAVLVPPAGRVGSADQPRPPASRSLEARTEGFLRTAAPAAARLAVLASAYDRLSLTLLHLIRQELVPEATTADLAELLTGSVFTLETQAGGAVELVVPPQVQGLLRQHLAERDVMRLDRAVSGYICAQVGGQGGMPAVAARTSEPGQDSPDAPDLPAELRPFAQASLRTLQLLGLAAPEATSAQPSRWPVPDQLPPQSEPFFVGRQNEVARAIRLVTGPGVPTVCITAPQGVQGAGATSLMLHVAHRVKEQFEDGVLFADLHTTNVSSALYGFLRALGVPSTTIPSGMQDMAELYRATLAGRRVLIVLDNPSTDSAARLHPTSPGCAVLATAKDAAGPFRSVVSLGPLDSASVQTLMRRFAPQPDGAVPAAHLTEPFHLAEAWPLAVKVIAKWVAADSYAPATLRAAPPGTPEQLPGWDLRSVLTARLNRLAPDRVRALLLLALHPRARLTLAEIAVLLGTTEREAQWSTDALVAAGLVERSPGDVHHLHDAIRSFAQAKGLSDLPAAEWRAALERLVSHHGRIVVSACTHEHPGDPLPRQVGCDPYEGPPEFPLGDYADRHPHLLTLLTPRDEAEDGDLGTRARLLVLLRDLAASPRHRTAYARAADGLSKAALAASDEASHSWAGVALAHSQLASHHFSRATATLTQLKAPPTELRCLIARLQADAALGQGKPTVAESLLAKAVDLAHENGDPFNETKALHRLAELLAGAGQRAAALRYLDRELKLLRTLGDEESLAVAARTLQNTLEHAPDLPTPAPAPAVQARAERASEHATVIMADGDLGDGSLYGRLLTAVRRAGALESEYRMHITDSTLTVAVARRVPVGRLVEALLAGLPAPAVPVFSMVVHTGVVHEDFTGTGIRTARLILRSSELNRTASELGLLNLLTVSDAAMLLSEQSGGAFAKVRLADESLDAWLHYPETARQPQAPVTDAAPDEELEALHSSLLAADPDGSVLAYALRDAFDFVLDGTRTGRFDVRELSRAERSVIGVKVEQAITSALALERGVRMDLRHRGTEFDLRFSGRRGVWAIPPETYGHICLLIHADDLHSRWGAGLLRIDPDLVLRPAGNRDGNRALRRTAMDRVRWLHQDMPLPENVLLHLDPDARAAVLTPRGPQRRVNELFRRAIGKRITVTTLTMVAGPSGHRRAREARRLLEPEGIAVLGPRDLPPDGYSAPALNEWMSVRVPPTPT
ncbi:NaeI family type II restriction endonuclease [Streptomyces sp. NRRL S-244]|uniref:NaeI family type II restriction endonuclease n=1 Tax=Streptomyces sp. NRRL S-244 TaxID=1463897 RepID=UPI00068EFA83|nr:NaeI family type II restriction endonuclease [Streptomyces sp. NRRL S-244]